MSHQSQKGNGAQDLSQATGVCALAGRSGGLARLHHPLTRLPLHLCLHRHDRPRRPEKGRQARGLRLQAHISGSQKTRHLQGACNQSLLTRSLAWAVMAEAAQSHCQRPHGVLGISGAAGRAEGGESFQ